MRYGAVVLGGLASAVLLAGAVSLATDTPALLAGTPIGVAIYLFVGVALPQSVLARRTGDVARLGLGTLAALAGAAVLVAGWRFGPSPLAGGSPFVSVLTVVVAGVIVGATVRAFRRGYGSAAEDG